MPSLAAVKELRDDKAVAAALALVQHVHLIRLSVTEHVELVPHLCDRPMSFSL